MADVKDILGISRDNGAGEPAPSSRKEKTKELRGRPKGMSRETFNLLYGTHPIPQGALLSEIAKKEDPKPGPSYTQVTYQFIPFRNEARTDDLRLYHWAQCYRDAAGQTRPVDDGVYPYAKYNTSAGAVRYDDVEYEAILRPKFPEAETGWSKEETDYLLDLCERFDLRFPIIADRYAPPSGRKRSVEDLKEHYYSLALELMRARAGDAVLASNLPCVRNPYDAQKERERKEFLAMTLSRTPAQVADEDQILAQAEAITEARKAQAAAKRSKGAPLMHETSFSNSVSELPFFDHCVVPFAPSKPGVYLRRAMLEESKKTAGQQVKLCQLVQKASKMVDTVLSDVAKVSTAPRMLTRAISGMFLALHSEAQHLVDLKLRGQRAPAKGAPVDEGRGKRSMKVKGRFDEMPAQPPKRSRITR